MARAVFINPSFRSPLTAAGLTGAKLEKGQYQTTMELPILDRVDKEHDAALKLQKVYRSFRTRRKLADCAVLVQERWEVSDFVQLNNSSVSYFDGCKHETGVSRWSRARIRAAKVGKGLSKNEKDQKLTFQHWLEAIDPRHRYGHNLQFYYAQWLHCQSREPFFYWLDVGEGKEVNLLEKCPRSKLHQQCIKYLGPMERKPYEVYISTDGKLFHKQTGAPLHTAGEGGDVKWIFVLSTTKIMYVGRKKKGSFQHSSFLAGGAALAAGRLVVEDGILKSAWPHSGHYRPTAENFRDFLSFLQENKVDLTSVKVKQETRLDSWEVDTEDSTEVLQVGKQLSGTWTTGAGPRIRYVRDYPPELQVQVLEQVSLSPRSSSRLSCSSENNSGFSPGKPTPWNQKGNILMKEAAVICQSPR